MLRHRSFFIAWVGALLAAPAQAAERVEAEFVEVSNSGLALVRTEARSEVVALEPGATLSGILSPLELRRGDRVAFWPERAARGVRFATRLELLPAVTTDPELVADIGQILGQLGPRRDATGAPTFFDVRSGAEYARGHLPGAVSAADWRSRLRSILPSDREASLVLYGRTRQDAETLEALRAALRLGYRNARVYLGGYREWSEENRPTLVRARDLAKRLGSDPMVVVDVRLEEEAARGSLPRSVSVVPSAMRSQDWTERPAMPVLVLVGRDAADPVPFEVAEKIRLWQPGGASIPRGSIQILEGGFEAWVAAGGALEKPKRSIDDLPCVPLPGEVCAAEFLRLWGEGGGTSDPLLLDVRPAAAAYRPGWARHLPIAELPQRLSELPRDREIVVFCARGINSRVAQGVLANAGFKARFVRLPAPGRP